MLISTIERLESVIKEVETEYDNAWRTTELDIRNSYSPQLSALNYAKPEIWESDDEFNQRIRTERTNINNERDRLITTRRREGEAEKAKQTESIRTQLQEALSILKRQTWTLKGSDVELIVGEYDRNAKIWPFTVVSRNSAVPVPSWPVIADFSRNSNLRDTLVKLDGAVKANALSAEIVWKIERKEENPSSYGGTKEIKYYVVLSQVAVRNIVDNSTVARDYVNKQIATFQPGRRNTTKSLFGSVKITTEGENAEIFIANRSIGTAPLNVNLLEGDYNVEAHWPNGWILSAPVSLSAGKSIVSRISKAPIRFVFVEGGTFQMGSINGNSDENPVHNVTVSSFLMSKYEVTQV